MMCLAHLGLMVVQAENKRRDAEALLNQVNENFKKVTLISLFLSAFRTAYVYCSWYCAACTAVQVHICKHMPYKAAMTL